MRPSFALILAALLLCAGCASVPIEPTFLPPPKVDGPKSGYVGDKVKFAAELTDPANVHETQWDFGDGSIADWDDGAETIKHKFAAVGIYRVKAREQCPILKEALRSDWSDDHKITITAKPQNVTRAKVLWWLYCGH